MLKNTNIKKSDFKSIPNIICYIRILLVPLFLYVYFTKEQSNQHVLSTIIILVSSFSDFLDGFIARKYNMVTELGKLIDPVADKLTQLVVACTLMYTYRPFILLVIVLILKDGMLLFFGYHVFKKTGNHIAQAQMPGKIATAVFFIVSIILIAFEIPGTFVANAMIYITVVLMMIALVYYAKDLIRLNRGE